MVQAYMAAFLHFPLVVKTSKYTVKYAFIVCVEYYSTP